MKADNPARFPGAIVTVLLRPFPNEAHNLESFGTSIEGFVLLLLIAHVVAPLETVAARVAARSGTSCTRFRRC